MKAVVVYYSLDGSTERFAKRIAEKTGADLIRLKPVKDFPKENGFKKFFLGGMSTIFKQKPKLSNGPLDLSPYDTVVVGTPVWAGGMASPVYSAMRRNSFTDKDVYLFACHASEEPGKCFDQLAALLGGSRIKGQVSFVTSPKGDPAQNDKKADEFCAKMIG